jgi:16S rRNA processing protein RimM
MNKKILVAKISSVFGIKGEVKIIAYLEDVLNIEKYEIFSANGEKFEIKISNKNKTIIGTSNGDPIIIAKIKGVDDRTAAEKMRGLDLYASREDFSKTKEDEFYYVDLIDLDVVDLENKKIGKVLAVNDHGAGAFLEIEFLEKKLPKNYQKIESFSFKNEIFPEVNLQKNFIKIELPEIVSVK